MKNRSTSNRRGAREVSRRVFLIAAGMTGPVIRLAAQSGQNAADDDAILRAMRDELERSRQLRVVGAGGDDLPYFISYTVDDQEVFSVAATLGAVTSTLSNHQRVPVIEVRVGSYDFDNTGHIYSGLYSGSRFDTEPWPLDQNYQNIRESLWLATDHAYKAAVESIARKRASLKNSAEPGDRLADYSKAEPVVSIGRITATKIDTTAWTNRVKKLSGIFGAYPEVIGSGVEFTANLGPTYYVNSEGTQVRYMDDVLWIMARAEGQARDGMVIRDGLQIQALGASQLPGEAELERAVTGLAERIKARVNAPQGESFSGPVLFEPEAAAQLMAQLIGDSVRINRRPVSDPNRPLNFTPSEFESRLGSRVAPEWLDAIDDPVQTAVEGRPLLGHYAFDLEGVPPKPVLLIEKGVLKSFLTTRQPVRGMSGSNGHARLAGGFQTKTVGIGNLFVKASRSEPISDLKKKLIQLCMDRGKAYGMLVRRLDYPFASTAGDLRSLLAASGQADRAISPPTLIYRVYPDGREELVRGLRFRGVSARSLRDVLAASRETAQFDFINNGAPLAMMGGGGVLAPASVIAPGLLFEELEFERPQEQLQRPPVAPPPSV